MAKVVCSNCGEKLPDGSPLHSNGFLGFEDVCNDCQLEAHTAYIAAKAERRAAALAAGDEDDTPAPSPRNGKGGK